MDRRFRANNVRFSMAEVEPDLEAQARRSITRLGTTPSSFRAERKVSTTIRTTQETRHSQPTPDPGAPDLAMDILTTRLKRPETYDWRAARSGKSNKRAAEKVKKLAAKIEASWQKA